MKTALKYTLFAFLATMTNISTQYISLSFYNGSLGLYVAMLLGTFTGLIVKYVLDKKFIFSFHVQSFIEDAGKFILYSFMGIFTTLIFWGTEIFFHFFFGQEGSKYIGAAIGLAIGYLTKYRLDKRFVFRKI